MDSRTCAPDTWRPPPAWAQVAEMTGDDAPERLHWIAEPTPILTRTPP